MSFMAIRLIAAFLVLAGIAVFAIWGMNLAGGAFANGLFVYGDGNYPILHLAAEFLMAGITLAGAIGWWAGIRWGRGLTLFGLGMFVYSSINSLGWALYNNPLVAIPMILTLSVAAFAVPYLMRHERDV